jgi:hypothetical protein
MNRPLQVVSVVCFWLVAFVATGQCRWEAASASLHFSNALWTGSRFVALGSDAGGFFVAVSATGLDWTVTARYGEAAPGLLAWDGHELLGISAPKAWTSPDAVIWTDVTTDLGVVQPTFLTWAGDRFFAYRPPVFWGSGSFLMSADGAQWSMVDRPLPEVRAVTHTGSQYIAVGGPGPYVGTSPDGISWTAQSLPSSVGTYSYLNDVKWNGRLLVAAGKDGLIATSNDGTTWDTQASGVSGWLYSVAVTPNGFLCGGDGGTLLTSQDGVTWSPEPTPTEVVIVHLVAGGYRTLAIDGNSRLFVRSCEPLRRIRRHLSSRPR